MALSSVSVVLSSLALNLYVPPAIGAAAAGRGGAAAGGGLLLAAWRRWGPGRWYRKMDEPDVELGLLP